MKKVICLLLSLAALASPAGAITTLTDDAIELSAPSAVLMEKCSGEIIYEKNAHEKLPPASVTKVMTLLLIVEAIDRGEIALSDTVTASHRASTFGGSCVYLEEGEQMSVDEMLKCITVVSANDCAVAMSEHLCGTEEAFVRRMNERASELGLQDTHFTNCTGLFDDDEHYTSAYDVALMSRELIRHELIKDYSTVWMDSIRGGKFGLSSTNKLVYYYAGCTGLKTGFTEKAGYCLSATAERDGVEYIAVIMHGESSEQRNNDAKTLLNFAFANYTLIPLRSDKVLPPVAVTMGKVESVQPVCEGPEAMLAEKQGLGELRFETELCESVAAPVNIGDRLGTLRVLSGDDVIAELPLVADTSAERAGFGDALRYLFKAYLGIA